VKIWFQNHRYKTKKALKDHNHAQHKSAVDRTSSPSKVIMHSELYRDSLIGPIPWGHSGPLCHALSLLSLLSMLLWTSMHRRRATVATPGEWQCKTGGVRRLAVANGPNIFQCFLFYFHSLCACNSWAVPSFPPWGVTGSRYGLPRGLVTGKFCGSYMFKYILFLT